MARMGTQRADGQKRPRSAPRGDGGHTQPHAALETCLQLVGSGEHGGPGEPQGSSQSLDPGGGVPAAEGQRELEGTLVL